MAGFHIKLKHHFAVWNLGQSGHPRHVGFNVPLPTGHWDIVYGEMNRANWIIVIGESHETNFIHANISAKGILRNSPGPCSCLPMDIRTCPLDEHCITLEARKSSHRPKTFALFLGERLAILSSSSLREVYIHDCWRQWRQQQVGVMNYNPKHCVKYVQVLNKASIGHTYFLEE